MYHLFLRKSLIILILLSNDTISHRFSISSVDAFASFRYSRTTSIPISSSVILRQKRNSKDDNIENSNNKSRRNNKNNENNDIDQSNRKSNLRNEKSKTNRSKNNGNKNGNNKTKNKKDDIINLLSNPYEAGVQFRQTLDRTLNLGMKKPLTNEQKAIYYLDDRFLDSSTTSSSSVSSSGSSLPSEGALAFVQRKQNGLFDDDLDFGYSLYEDNDYIPEVLVIGMIYF